VGGMREKINIGGIKGIDESIKFFVIVIFDVKSGGKISEEKRNRKYHTGGNEIKK
jgi:hypothetical protein